LRRKHAGLLNFAFKERAPVKKWMYRAAAAAAAAAESKRER
jgi:hypothetical protein